MIKGIGCDIVDNRRIKLKIAPKILVESEMVRFNEINEDLKIEYLASRFAIKEAIIKATNKQYNFSNIEIKTEKNGKPICNIDGMHISISHEKNYSLGYAIWED